MTDFVDGPIVQLGDPFVAAQVVEALDLLAAVRRERGRVDGLDLPLSSATRRHRDACEQLVSAATGSSPGRTAGGVPTMSVMQAMEHFELPGRTVRYQCRAVWAPAGKARKVGRDWRIDVDVAYSPRKGR